MGGGQQRASYLFRSGGRYMSVAGVVVLDNRPGQEPIFGWFSPDMLLEDGSSTSVARFFYWACDDRLNKEGMLVGPPVVGVKTEDRGENGLAHTRPGTPDLISAQFWP